MRWSLVTSENGTKDVGSKEAINQTSPNAIGRVSFFLEVWITVTSKIEKNITPIIILSSNIFVMTHQSESALKLTGIKKAIQYLNHT